MKTCIQKISLLLALAISGLLTQAQTQQTIKITASTTIASQVIINGSQFDATLAPDLKPFLPITIKIENTGSSALTLTKVSGKYITLSGTGAADFAIDESPLTGSIAAGTSQSVTVQLSPTATNGSGKVFTISISNNDPVNGSYVGSIKYNLASVTVPTSLTKASDIGLSLYPNPSSDGHFFITANNVAVEKVVVSNVSGVTEEFAAKEFITSLTGLLLVKIYTDKGIVSEKVIIQE